MCEIVRCVKTKRSGPVSRVLYRQRVAAGACHLSRTRLTACLLSFGVGLRNPIVLPSGSGGPSSRCRCRSSLGEGLSAPASSPVYANFQPPVCTARMSPCAWWALTPPSHPYPGRGRGGSFLLHVLTLAGYYLLGSGVPCVARTFLCRHVKGRQRQAVPLRFAGAKIRQNVVTSKKRNVKLSVWVLNRC